MNLLGNVSKISLGFLINEIDVFLEIELFTNMYMRFVFCFTLRVKCVKGFYVVHYYTIYSPRQTTY